MYSARLMEFLTHQVSSCLNCVTRWSAKVSYKYLLVIFSPVFTQMYYSVKQASSIGLCRCLTQGLCQIVCDPNSASHLQTTLLITLMATVTVPMLKAHPVHYS